MSLGETLILRGNSKTTCFVVVDASPQGREILLARTWTTIARRGGRSLAAQALNVQGWWPQSDELISCWSTRECGSLVISDYIIVSWGGHTGRRVLLVFNSADDNQQLSTRNYVLYSLPPQLVQSGLPTDPFLRCEARQGCKPVAFTSKGAKGWISSWEENNFEISLFF